MAKPRLRDERRAADTAESTIVRSARESAVADLRDQGREEDERTERYNQALRSNRHTVPYSEIERDENQPRRLFDETKLWDLARTIAKKGLRESLRAYPSGVGRFRLVDGERRWRAIGLLIASDEHPEFTTSFPVPIVVEDRPGRGSEAIAELRVDQLITSFEKESFTPLEEVAAILEVAKKTIPGQTIGPADIRDAHGLNEWKVGKLLRVGNGLSPQERDAIETHWPKASLDSLETLASTLTNASLDDHARAEAIEIFYRKKPSAGLVEPLLVKAGLIGKRGRPAQLRAKVRQEKDGSFTVELRIPAKISGDSEVLARARRELLNALAHVEEMERAALLTG